MPPNQLAGRMNLALGVLAVLPASMPLIAQEPAPTLQFHVGANVAVWPGGKQQAEPFIAAHPSKPGLLIIGTGDWTSDWGLLPTAYVTSDAGRTWTRRPLPHLADELAPSDRVEGAGDPWLSFGANGVAYFSAMQTVRGRDSTVRLYQSQDIGLHWELLHVMHGGSLDAAKILPVATEGRLGLLLLMNAFGKDLQAFGRPQRNAAAIATFRSEDQGKSFMPTALIAPGNASYGMSHAICLADGSILVLFSEFGREPAAGGETRSGYYTARSTDGGRTFAVPSPLANVRRPYPDGAWLAADTSHSRFAGRVYATWEDGDFGARVTFVDGKRVRQETGAHRAVAIARSDDQGRTWSSPVLLEAAGAGPCYMSTVAVSVTGMVGVLWIQHEHYENNPHCYRPYFTASTDGGKSFAAPVPVSDSVSCPATTSLASDFFTYRPRGGDYIGLAAAADGSFHAVWSDARDGMFKTFTARITVSTANLPR